MPPNDERPPSNESPLNPPTSTEPLQSNEYLYIGEGGKPEAINIFTGSVRKLELTPEDLLGMEPQLGKDGRTRFVVRDQSPGYNPMYAEIFAYHILEGKGVLAACKEVGISYTTYAKWKSNYESFRTIVEQARQDRGEVFFDRIEEYVMQAGDNEDEIALARLRMDAMKYLAQVSDPRRFSPTTKVDAKIGIAKVVVDTGIRRVGDAGYLASDMEAITDTQTSIANGETLPVAVGAGAKNQGSGS